MDGKQKIREHLGETERACTLPASSKETLVPEAPLRVTCDTNHHVEGLRGFQGECPQRVYRWVMSNIPKDREHILRSYLQGFCPWGGYTLEDWVAAAVQAPGNVTFEQFRDSPGDAAWACGIDHERNWRLALFRPSGQGYFYWVPGCGIWLRVGERDPHWWDITWEGREMIQTPSLRAIEALAPLDKAVHHQLAYDLLNDSSEPYQKLGAALWARQTENPCR